MFKIVTLAAILLLAGCSKNVPLHPGAANQFDSQTYDALISTKAAITTAQQELPTHPELRDTLKRVAASWNTVDHAYKAYHQAAIDGKTPDAQTLTAQIATLQADVAAMVAAFRGGTK